MKGDGLAVLRLIRSRKVGPATFHRLLAEHGSPDAALAALPDMARAAGLDSYAPCPRSIAEAEIEAIVAGQIEHAGLCLHGDDAQPQHVAGMAQPALFQ